MLQQGEAECKLRVAEREKEALRLFDATLS